MRGRQGPKSNQGAQLRLPLDDKDAPPWRAGLPASVAMIVPVPIASTPGLGVETSDRYERYCRGKRHSQGSSVQSGHPDQYDRAETSCRRRNFELQLGVSLRAKI